MLDLDSANIDENYVVDELSKVLNDAQDKYFDVEDGVVKCKQLLGIRIANTSCNVVQIFIEHFKNCLENVLIIGVNSAFASKVPHLINFMASFLVDLIETSGDDSLFLITWKNIFGHLLNNHRASNDTVRYRICQILHIVLKLNYDNSNQINIVNDMRKRLQQCLLERMKDIKEDVQLEAIKSLRYLQDESDKFCPVLNSFSFILQHNGLSLKSRVQILDSIALNSDTLLVIKKLIYNPDIEIRLKAYDILIESVSLRLFDDKYRVCLLRCLLKEEEFLLNLYLSKMINRWLSKVDNNYRKFISLFNFKKYLTAVEASKALTLMNMAFEASRYDCSIQEKFLQDCSLESDFNLYDLNPNTAFYFRSLVSFLKSDSSNEQRFLKSEPFGYNYLKIFEHIEIFIHEVMMSQSSEKADSTRKHKDDVFILEQLFHLLMCHKESFDSKFLERFESEISSIACGAVQFDEDLLGILFKNWKLLERNDRERLRKFSMLIAQIEELYGEEIADVNNNSSRKIDAKKEEFKLSAVKTCLFIVCELLNDSTVQEINAIVEANLEDLILPNVCSTNPKIRVLAVRALGLSCLVSVDLALSYLLLFVKITEVDNTLVVLEAQKALFNILLCFNMGNLDECLNIEISQHEFNEIIESDDVILSPLKCEKASNDGVVPTTTTTRAIMNNSDISKLLTVTLKSLAQQIQCLNYEVKFIACEGFAKLFLSRRIINNVDLLSKLMLILFDPSVDCEDGVKIKSCLLAFFSVYAKKYNISVFDQVMLNAVDVIIKAPSDLSFSRINLKNLSNYCSFLINYNEDNCKVHDRVLLQLVERMRVELKFNSVDAFTRILLVLLEFYNDKEIHRKNGETMKKIDNVVKSILEFARQKTGLLNKIGDFKPFIAYIKDCLSNVSEKSASKRKSVSSITDFDANDSVSSKKQKA